MNNVPKDRPMRPYLAKIHYFMMGVALMLLLNLTVHAQSTVRFALDMSTYPLEPNDLVMVCGSGASLGEWQVYRHMMAPSPDNPNLYTVEVPFSAEEVGAMISYKYVVVKPGDVQYWEEVASRSLKVPAQATAMAPAYFENRSALGVTQTVLPVTISVDMREWENFEDHIDALGIKGSLYPLPLTLRKESEPLALSDEDADGIWEVTFNVLYGSPREFSFSLYYLEQDVWNLHMLYGKLEHVALLPTQSTQEVRIALAYNPRTGGYESRSKQRLYVDDYAGLYQALGEWGQGTRFEYFVAIHLLEQGKPQQAKEAYQNYTQTRNTGWDVRDDFDHMWIQHLGETQGMEQAEAYARKVGEDSYTYLQRSYMAKAAEVAFMQGDHARAKRLVRALHSKPQFTDRLTWNEYFSRQLLAMSYLEDAQEDSTAAAMELLRQAGSDSSDTYWQRNALWQQVYLHTDKGQTEPVEALYQTLATSGAFGQRMAARQHWVEYYLRLGDLAMAEQKLDQAEHALSEQMVLRSQALEVEQGSLGDSRPSSHEQWWVRQQLQRARFYQQRGDRKKAQEILQQAKQGASAKHAQRLERAITKMLGHTEATDEPQTGEQ